MRHEMHLTARGLKAVLPVAAAAIAVGSVLAGVDGAMSAAMGAALVAANHGAAAASTGWARTLSPNVLAVGYLMFVVRMFVMFAAFAVLATLPWVHQGLLASSFCASLIVSLTVQCLSYARGTYVPAWRSR